VRRLEDGRIKVKNNYSFFLGFFIDRSMGREEKGEGK
jgi:hypothetical protein